MFRQLLPSQEMDNNSDDTSTYFQFPSSVQNFFQLDFSANPDLLSVRDGDSVGVKKMHSWSSNKKRTPNLNEDDKLSSLPDDMLREILKRVHRYSDMQSLRFVSRFWREAFIDLAHASHGFALGPRGKALWICTLKLHDSKNMAFVSNYTCSRRKLYGKVFRFPDSEIYPKNTRMVASEAGLLCLKVQLPEASNSTEVSNFRLLICNPLLMEYKSLHTLDQYLQEKAHGMCASIGLMTDSTTMSYKVLVASPGVNVEIFDSRSAVWTLGRAPPKGVLFSGSRNAVTYHGCIYCVAYTERRQEFHGRLFCKMWFIMQYNLETDMWTRMGDIPKVHQLSTLRVCQHVILPDLVRMWDGVILVAENDTQTGKHIFQLDERTCKWRFRFNVPMPNVYLTSLGRVKCMGVQKKLFFQLPNALPVLEVDMVAESWAWCLPVGLNTKHDVERFSRILDVKEALPFEPSFYPVSGFRSSDDYKARERL